MALVSVIIPAYNAEAFIAEALDSVINQTIQDFEVVVIDDGSTDRTADIVKHYDSRVKLISVDNGGPAKARNRGIRESGGEYVAFLDADDLWQPTKLEKQLARFRESPKLGMVFTENYLFDSKGPYADALGKRDTLMPGEIAANILIHSGLSTPTVMVRKSVLDAVGEFDESLKHAEDDNMWIRISAQYPVCLIDESLVGVRDHDNRCTRNLGLSIDSVRRNIELLQTEYGERVRLAVAPAIPRALSDAHFDQGYIAFEQDDLVKARKEFWSALELYPTNKSTYTYLALSMIPGPLLRFLRRSKRRLISTKSGQNRWVRDE